jgi:hypothetical protein
LLSLKSNDGFLNTVIPSLSRDQTRGRGHFGIRFKKAVILSEGEPGYIVQSPDLIELQSKDLVPNNNSLVEESTNSILQGPPAYVFQRKATFIQSSVLSAFFRG